jgi:aerobic carbon-monoxide dehydrogenase small subunit
VPLSNDNLTRIAFQLNGKPISLEVTPWDSALTVLRDLAGLKGTKEGCGIGECGACTILVDGRAVDSCLMFAPQLDGRDVETVEGLKQAESLHPLQEAFVSCGAVQCGFCSPGMVMSTKALLQKHPNPSREQVVEALAGNLCRCTGYNQVIEAIQTAANAASPDRSKKL